jgi:hypothetical protein
MVWVDERFASSLLSAVQGSALQSLEVEWHLLCNSLSSSVAQNALALELARALAGLRALTKLSLCLDGEVTEAAFVALAESVSQSQQLRSFALQSSLNDGAVPAFFRMLGVNSLLKEMCLGLTPENDLYPFPIHVSDEVCTLLADALRENTTLCRLHLAIEDDGHIRALKVLKSAFCGNFSLTHICVEVCDDVDHILKRKAFSDLTSRNTSAWKQRAALQTLARFADLGFASMTSLTFRNALLEHFLPPRCKFVLPSQASLPFHGQVHVEQGEILSSGKELDSLASSSAQDVNQFVEHQDPPALIDPVEAALTQEEQRISYIEHRLATEASESDPMPSAESNARRRVLLSFSRFSDMLESALLSSSPAEVARARGVDVQPSWARGAKIFVEDICVESLDPALLDMLTPSRALIYEDDIEDLLREFREDKQLPYRVFKVKPLDRMPAVPEEMSLMNTSTLAAQSSDATSSTSSTASDVVITVHNTFWRIFGAQSDPRSVLSADF